MTVAFMARLNGVLSQLDHYTKLAILDENLEVEDDLQSFEEWKKNQIQYQVSFIVPRTKARAAFNSAPNFFR